MSRVGALVNEEARREYRRLLNELSWKEFITLIEHADVYVASVDATRALLRDPVNNRWVATFNRLVQPNKAAELVASARQAHNIEKGATFHTIRRKFQSFMIQPLMLIDFICKHDPPFTQDPFPAIAANVNDQFFSNRSISRGDLYRSQLIEILSFYTTDSAEFVAAVHERVQREIKPDTAPLKRSSSSSSSSSSSLIRELEKRRKGVSGSSSSGSAVREIDPGDLSTEDEDEDEDGDKKASRAAALMNSIAKDKGLEEFEFKQDALLTREEAIVKSGGGPLGIETLLLTTFDVDKLKTSVENSDKVKHPTRKAKKEKDPRTIESIINDNYPKAKENREIKEFFKQTKAAVKQLNEYGLYETDDPDAPNGERKIADALWTLATIIRTPNIHDKVFAAKNAFVGDAIKVLHELAFNALQTYLINRRDKAVTKRPKAPRTGCRHSRIHTNCDHYRDSTVYTNCSHGNRPCSCASKYKGRDGDFHALVSRFKNLRAIGF